MGIFNFAILQFSNKRRIRLNQQIPKSFWCYRFGAYNVLAMKTLVIDSRKIDGDIIEEAAEVLRSGGIVAHPTDTCYGLAVDIFNEEALKNFYERKGMDFDKPVSVLVRSLEEAEQYGVFSELALRLAKEFWPGPLTLVVPRTAAVPSFLNPKQSDVGLRVISEPVTVALLNAFGGPVTTTSANAHGESTPYSLPEISMKSDFILDAGDLKRSEKPSTVIRIEGDHATVIRQGNLFLDI